ncbi:TetR family transcriptional regulator [Sphingobium sp. TomMM35A]
MSRRKSLSDDALLDALLVAVREHGPAELSFARAASYAGLAAPTLVQRFGSRTGMIEAVLLRAWNLLEARTAEADANSGPGASGAIEFLMRLTLAGDADYDCCDGLLLLREDIKKPVLRDRGAKWADTLAEAIARRLPETVDRVCLAWEAIRLWQGAMFWWAFQRDHPIDEVVKSAMDGWLVRNGDQRPFPKH